MVEKKKYVIKSYEDKIVRWKDRMRSNYIPEGIYEEDDPTPPTPPVPPRPLKKVVNITGAGHTHYGTNCWPTLVKLKADDENQIYGGILPTASFFTMFFSLFFPEILERPQTFIKQDWYDIMYSVLGLDFHSLDYSKLHFYNNNIYVVGADDLNSDKVRLLQIKEVDDNHFECSLNEYLWSEAPADFLELLQKYQQGEIIASEVNTWVPLAILQGWDFQDQDKINWHILASKPIEIINQNVPFALEWVTNNDKICFDNKVENEKGKFNFKVVSIYDEWIREYHVEDSPELIESLINIKIAEGGELTIDSYTAPTADDEGTLVTTLVIPDVPNEEGE